MCAGFRLAWAAARDSSGGSGDPEEDATLERFMAADQAMASPLTRAVQTCLLALQGHPALAASGVRLQRHAREKKNRGGLDTVGTEVGSAIAARVHSELAAEIQGGAEAAAACLDGVVIDPHDATSEWWTSLQNFDTADMIADRLGYLLRSLRYTTGGAPLVLAGHSLIFRELCRAYLPVPAAAAAEPGLWGRLRKFKMANGACLELEIEFPPLAGAGAVSGGGAAPPEIARARLAFGTKLSQDATEKSEAEEELAAEAGKAGEAAEEGGESRAEESAKAIEVRAAAV